MVQNTHNVGWFDFLDFKPNYFTKKAFKQNKQLYYFIYSELFKSYLLKPNH